MDGGAAILAFSAFLEPYPVGALAEFLGKYQPLRLVAGNLDFLLPLSVDEEIVPGGACFGNVYGKVAAGDVGLKENTGPVVAH